MTSSAQMRIKPQFHDQCTASQRTIPSRTHHCPYSRSNPTLYSQEMTIELPQSGPHTVQPCAALLTVSLVTSHLKTHSTIPPPYMLHSAKIWAAFPPYFWVSVLPLYPYTCNRSRIGPNCCLHHSLSMPLFLTIEFWLSTAISQKICEGFASTFAFSLFALARNGLSHT